MKSTGEDSGKIFEMTTKDLEHYVNLVGTVKTSFEKADSNFKRGSVVDKCYQTSWQATEKLYMKGRVNLCVVLIKEIMLATESSTTTTLISQQPATLRQTYLQQKDYSSLKARVMSVICGKKKSIFKLRLCV